MHAHVYINPLFGRS